MTERAPHASRPPGLVPRAALRVAIVGGGPAALEAMIALRRGTTSPLDIALLSENATLKHKPLAVREPFGHRLPETPLAPLAARHGARWRRTRVEAVDPDRRRLRLAGGTELRYDALIVATGAAQRPPRPDALTLGSADGGPALRRLVEELESRTTEAVAFAVPSRACWSLPLYELALQTSAHLRRRGIDEVRLTLVTPEPAPLAVFGSPAAEMMASRLSESGIELRVSTYPFTAGEGELEVTPGRPIPAQRVVWAPTPEARLPEGLPADDRGYLPTDRYGRVEGASDTYAAGDVTSWPVKQGGLAAQQAAAAAASVIAAADPGAEPQLFKPLLRAIVLTGSEPIYLQTPLESPGQEPAVSLRPLWWPAEKIAARYLAAELH